MAYKSVSLEDGDYKEYEELRHDFAKENGLPVSKVSMPMIIRIGMTFYKQRRNLKRVGAEGSK